MNYLDPVVWMKLIVQKMWVILMGIWKLCNMKRGKNSIRKLKRRWTEINNNMKMETKRRTKVMSNREN